MPKDYLKEKGASSEFAASFANKRANNAFGAGMPYTEISALKHKLDFNAEARKDAMEVNAELPSYQKKSAENIRKKYPVKMMFHTDEVDGHTHGPTKDKKGVKTIDKSGNIRDVSKADDA